MQNAEARVVLNRKRGTIVVTGEVQISPSGIAVRGMTITTAGPTAENDAEAVPVDTRSFVALDQNLEKEAGASLTNLLDALNQLKVDTNRQMDVIEELNRAGQLHAKLIVVEE
jgi:flagellar P-ring protein precursor FlgI